MKAILLATSLVVSSMALAETATFQVKGMHCGSCVSAVESKVCKMDGVQSCKAELTNAKKKMGTVTITTPEGTPVDAVKVEELVSSAGDYHIVRTPKK